MSESTGILERELEVAVAAPVPQPAAHAKAGVSWLPATPVPPAAAPPRLESIDLLRGLVIALMALDHVRDFMSTVRSMDTAQMTTAYFLTRVVTHVCAPTFVFLAGTSAWLTGRRYTAGELSRFLVVRGILLIAAEVTIVAFGWFFNTRYLTTGLGLQVIWVIGASMIALAGLVHVPRRVLLAFGLVLVAGHNTFDPIRPDDLGAWASAWQLLHVQGPTTIGAIKVFVAYPLVPWVGVMALGYVFGPLLATPPDPRRRRLLALGAALTLAFVALRAMNGYGDPNRWSLQSPLGVLSFLDANKYPPSLLFLLMTLGPAIASLAWLERWKGPVARAVACFGRVPFFFYVVHLYAIHALAVLAGWLQGYPPAAMLDLFLFLPAGYGVPLPGVYAIWAGLMLVLYLPCRWFGGIKERRRSPWLSYL